MRNTHILRAISHVEGEQLDRVLRGRVVRCGGLLACRYKSTMRLGKRGRGLKVPSTFPLTDLTSIDR